MTRAGTLVKAVSFVIATMGAAAFVATVALPDAVYAKNGNGGGKGGGNGGGKGGNGGEKGGGKSDRGGANKGGQGKAKAASKSAAKASAAPKVKAKKKVLPIVEVTEGTPLLPRQKGKWNAVNANQAALDAHIRNQNFNGTIGALSQYQVVAKAASGAELSEAEAAAIESLLGGASFSANDQDLADFLNADTVDGDPVYSVEDGVVTCTENCESADIDAAQALADAEAERVASEGKQQALDDLLVSSEGRIVNESNKPLSPEGTEQLLDELASALGVMRAEPESEGMPEDPIDEPAEEPVDDLVEELVEELE